MSPDCSLANFFSSSSYRLREPDFYQADFKEQNHCLGNLGSSSYYYYFASAGPGSVSNSSNGSCVNSFPATMAAGVNN